MLLSRTRHLMELPPLLTRLCTHEYADNLFTMELKVKFFSFNKLPSNSDKIVFKIVAAFREGLFSKGLIIIGRILSFKKAGLGLYVEHDFVSEKHPGKNKCTKW